LGKDLPFEPLNVVREDPRFDSILYTGSDGGIYVSFDAGNTFMAWNNGLPASVPVHDIAIQQRENELVLGTHGRSLYIASLGLVQKIFSDPKEKARASEEADKRRPLQGAADVNGLFDRQGLEVAAALLPAEGTKKKRK
jgi:hypothetical protein